MGEFMFVGEFINNVGIFKYFWGGSKQ